MNSLYQQMNPQAMTQMPNINNGMVQSIKNMMNMCKAAQNPQKMIEVLAGQNPQISGVMKMLGGKNPKDVFYEQCKQQGIDPNTVLNMLK